MSEIEKIEKYIARTKIKNRNAAMETKQMEAIYQRMQTEPFQTIILLFEYGRAKGYRVTKSEGRARS